MNKYRFASAKAAAKLLPEEFEDADLADDYSTYLVKTKPDGASEIVCRDGGEPEDMRFGRDLNPVVGVIAELQRERDAAHAEAAEWREKYEALLPK